jgi:hypothetical protein
MMCCDGRAENWLQFILQFTTKLLPNRRELPQEQFVRFAGSWRRVFDSSDGQMHNVLVDVICPNLPDRQIGHERFAGKVIERVRKRPLGISPRSREIYVVARMRDHQKGDSPAITDAGTVPRDECFRSCPGSFIRCGAHQWR